MGSRLRRNQLIRHIICRPIINFCKGCCQELVGATASTGPSMLPVGGAGLKLSGSARSSCTPLPSSVSISFNEWGPEDICFVSFAAFIEILHWVAADGLEKLGLVGVLGARQARRAPIPSGARCGMSQRWLRNSWHHVMEPRAYLQDKRGKGARGPGWW